MARYFYVKAGGTKTTGSNSSPQTGSFTSLGVANYYADLAAVNTANTFQDNDYICISHLTDVDLGGAFTVGDTNLTGMNRVCFMSVDDTDITEELFGAKYTYTTMSILGGSILRGLYLDSTVSSGEMMTQSGSNWYGNEFYNCKFEIMATNISEARRGGNSYYFYDCEFMAGRLNSIMMNENKENFHLILDNCFFTTKGVGTWQRVFTDTGDITEGFHTELYGCDFSVFTDNPVYMNLNTPSDDKVLLEASDCKTPTGLLLVHMTTAPEKPVHKMETRRCGDGAEAEHQYHLITSGGVVLDDTSIYKDSSLQWPVSLVKTSLHVNPFAHASRQLPFRFKLPTTFVKFSRADSQILRVTFITTGTPNTSEIWAKARFPTVADPSLFRTATSKASLLSSTVIASDVSTNDWQDGGGLTTKNRYYIDIDCSTGAQGADSAIDIEICVGLNLDIWVNPDIETL